MIDFPHGISKKLHNALQELLEDFDFTHFQHCERIQDSRNIEAMDDIIYLDIFAYRRDCAFVEWLNKTQCGTLSHGHMSWLNGVTVHRKVQEILQQIFASCARNGAAVLLMPYGPPQSLPVSHLDPGMLLDLRNNGQEGTRHQ
jgi:hypothetical protein